MLETSTINLLFECHFVLTSVVTKLPFISPNLLSLYFSSTEDKCKYISTLASSKSSDTTALRLLRSAKLLSLECQQGTTDQCLELLSAAHPEMLT